MRLDSSFFNRPTITVAQELLGKHLFFHSPNGKLVGEINEVECYIGEDDLASHAARGKTIRTAPMYLVGGYTYIYLIYGMYYCLNIVTEHADYPAAILIRSVIPIEGIEQMRKNRSKTVKSNRELTNGPGKLCSAFGFTTEHNALDLTMSPKLMIEDVGKSISRFNRTPRIGISKAADKLWRFVY